MNDLHQAILTAHEADDRPALVDLYLSAADQAEGQAKPFFLTQAWVLALEVGDARAKTLEAQLNAMGAA